MWVRILKDTVCDGAGVKSGAVVDASLEAGLLLVKIGKAERTEAPSASVPEENNRRMGKRDMQKRAGDGHRIGE